MLILSCYQISKNTEHIIGINEDYILLSVKEKIIKDKNGVDVQTYTLQTLNNKDTPLIALKIRLIENRDFYPKSVTNSLAFVYEIPLIQDLVKDPLERTTLIYVK